MSVDSTALERSALERKERDELVTIAQALGGKPAARAAKATIVNLIRETRLDAKIDSQEGTVVMNHQPNNVYQQVIEKTKGGFFRTQVLSAAVSK